MAQTDDNPVGQIWDYTVDGPHIPTEIIAPTHVACVWCVGCNVMLKRSHLANTSSLSCELLHHVTEGVCIDCFIQLLYSVWVTSAFQNKGAVTFHQPDILIFLAVGEVGCCSVFPLVLF